MPFQSNPDKFPDYDVIAVSESIRETGRKKKNLLNLIREYGDKEEGPEKENLYRNIESIIYIL